MNRFKQNLRREIPKTMVWFGTITLILDAIALKPLAFVLVGVILLFSWVEIK